MAQKQSPEKQVEALLQTIDPSKFADESLRHTLTILLNVIEQQQLKIKELSEENQKLRDENNLGLWCSDAKLVTQLKRMRVLRRGTFLCLLLQLLVNWESASSSTYVTGFISLVKSPNWILLFEKNSLNPQTL
ncbi:hypothetical protein H1Q63_28565 [Desmonostoc muscorum CCALA 125]|nr:hypothetical protein [Desmonostoc muscorum CCALA 125]